MDALSGGVPPPPPPPPLPSEPPPATTTPSSDGAITTEAAYEASVSSSYYSGFDSAPQLPPPQLPPPLPQHPPHPHPAEFEAPPPSADQFILSRVSEQVFSGDPYGSFNPGGPGSYYPGYNYHGSAGYGFPPAYAYASGTFSGRGGGGRGGRGGYESNYSTYSGGNNGSTKLNDISLPKDPEPEPSRPLGDLGSFSIMERAEGTESNHQQARSFNMFGQKKGITKARAEQQLKSYKSQKAAKSENGRLQQQSASPTTTDVIDVPLPKRRSRFDQTAPTPSGPPADGDKPNIGSLNINGTGLNGQNVVGGRVAKPAPGSAVKSRLYRPSNSDDEEKLPARSPSPRSRDRRDRSDRRSRDERRDYRDRSERSAEHGRPRDRRERYANAGRPSEQDNAEERYSGRSVDHDRRGQDNAERRRDRDSAGGHRHGEADQRRGGEGGHRHGEGHRRTSLEDEAKKIKRTIDIPVPMQSEPIDSHHDRKEATGDVSLQNAQQQVAKKRSGWDSSPDWRDQPVNTSAARESGQQQSATTMMPRLLTVKNRSQYEDKAESDHVPRHVPLPRLDSSAVQQPSNSDYDPAHPSHPSPLQTTGAKAGCLSAVTEAEEIVTWPLTGVAQTLTKPTIPFSSNLAAVRDFKTLFATYFVESEDTDVESSPGVPAGRDRKAPAQRQQDHHTLDRTMESDEELPPEEDAEILRLRKEALVTLQKAQLMMAAVEAKEKEAAARRSVEVKRKGEDTPEREGKSKSKRRKKNKKASKETGGSESKSDAEVMEGMEENERPHKKAKKQKRDKKAKKHKKEKRAKKKAKEEEASSEEEEGQVNVDSDEGEEIEHSVKRQLGRGERRVQQVYVQSEEVEMQPAKFRRVENSSAEEDSLEEQANSVLARARTVRTGGRKEESSKKRKSKKKKHRERSGSSNVGYHAYAPDNDV